MTLAAIFEIATQKVEELFFSNEGCLDFVSGLYTADNIPFAKLVGQGTFVELFWELKTAREAATGASNGHLVKAIDAFSSASDGAWCDAEIEMYFWNGGYDSDLEGPRNLATCKEPRLLHTDIRGVAKNVIEDVKFRGSKDVLCFFADTLIGQAFFSRLSRNYRHLPLMTLRKLLNNPILAHDCAVERVGFEVDSDGPTKETKVDRHAVMLFLFFLQLMFPKAKIFTIWTQHQGSKSSAGGKILRALRATRQRHVKSLTNILKASRKKVEDKFGGHDRAFQIIDLVKKYRGLKIGYAICAKDTSDKYYDTVLELEEPGTFEF